MYESEKMNLWLQIRSEIKKRIDQKSYQTWFDPTVYIGQENDALYIKVPNSYFKDWLSFHYSSLINSCSLKSFSEKSSRSNTYMKTPPNLS